MENAENAFKIDVIRPVNLPFIQEEMTLLGIEFYLFVSHGFRFSKFTRGSSVASYLHEKQTSRIQSLYLYFNYFIKIVPFWLRNIRFLIENTRSLFYGRHYSSLHRLMLLHRKLNVKIFLMFIVAENTGSVNIDK